MRPSAVLPRQSGRAHRQGRAQREGGRGDRPGDGGGARGGQARGRGGAGIPLRPCLGCGALIRSGSRCERCDRMRGGSWTALRTRVIAAAGGRCQSCGSPRHLEVHHVDGNPTNNAPENLQALCRACHRGGHAPSRPKRPVDGLRRHERRLGPLSRSLARSDGLTARKARPARWQGYSPSPRESGRRRGRFLPDLPDGRGPVRR
jgi:hypothetical protein